MPELDILYMTRVQKERFFNEEDYVRMKDFLYSGQGESWSLAEEDMYVLHPLPRVNEIAVEVDCRSKSSLFQTGPVRRLCPHGSDSHITGGRITMLNVGALR